MTYNGHKNWNHWNVSPWINNDEALYNFARSCKRESANLREAAQEFLDYLPENKTPDGARYSLSSVMAALRGL